MEERIHHHHKNKITQIQNVQKRKRQIHLNSVFQNK